jgi:L,D-peptidoglycan transpeptidase YkuD (ErfK/YbiS/YcfS/YnhG family)
MISKMAPKRWKNFKAASWKTLGAALVCAAFASGASLQAAPLDGVRQLIVGVGQTWDSPNGKLQRFEKAGANWKAVGAPVPVLFGRQGMAWGRGVLGTDEPGRHKAEKDWRAPAGVFRIGKIYTYDKALPSGAEFPYHTVTDGDAWIDDVKHPQYNQHVRIDPSNPPAWFEKQKMRHGDFAYRWLVEVRHNSDPPVSGAGSAIFFHIRRGAQRPSAGCTTMAEDDLITLIRWLRAGSKPHYALLPKAEYLQRWQAWGLPAPDAAAPLLN